MSESLATAPVPTELGAEAVTLLKRLIRIDTVNPPGRERPAQEELRDLLADAGFECELLGAEPERPNLIARLAGEAAGPTLTLLGHVDTVRADRSDWSRDPWAGELAGGLVWGRGALDMKGQVAAEVAACARLGRGGWRPPRGRLQIVLTADEERGGRLGALWLCENHPEKVRSDYVVNEGGGASFELGGRRIYTLCIGEKGVFRFWLRARGRAGHASLPGIGDNALLKLAPYLARLVQQPPPEPTPEGLESLSALFEERFEGTDGMEEGLARLRAEQPLVAEFLAKPMLGVSLAPTVARASEKENVIPSTAEVMVDCRVPPGFQENQVRERVEAVIGDGDYEIEFAARVIGNSSPPDTPLADAIRSWLAEADPGAALVPIVMPGFSDSQRFRQAFGTAVVYGFCPLRGIDLWEAAALIHGADERVPVADVELGARFFFELPQRLLS
jgi:acetylornithine deacetylase/succinyl-diaminopimelate desuccinylase-like protein